MEFTQDYYSILGVAPDATDEDLRSAYRVAARRFHPDVNKAPGAALIFRDINNAYELLSDLYRRREYDQLVGTPGKQASKLEISVQYSRLHFQPLDEPQLVYALVKVQPVLEHKPTTDTPLNLCLLMDKSTSMKGARMQHLKAASHRIIDECHERDILSIVLFSDKAEILVSAQHPDEPRRLKAMVSTIQPGGATAILQGLRAAMAQVERHRNARYVNHIVLVTDGRTYGDEEDCLKLATEAHQRGVGISGMGIGDDWNDHFLDTLASKTGGSSTYVVSPEMVSRFLRERVRSLATAYAERGQLLLVPGAEVELNSVMRISPNPMEMSVTPQPIPMGMIDGLTPTTLMLQFHVNANGANLGTFFLGRIDISAEVLGSGTGVERIVHDLTIEISESTHEEESPPELLDALSKLILYRLQDRARDDIANGRVAEGTSKLENLATRLIENGQEDLAQAALQEAQNALKTSTLSEEGAKRLKYGTRALLPLAGDVDD
jgi:Ca-activated chloride channel family protein